MVGYLQPIFAGVVGAVLLSEWPQPSVVLGGVIVLAGVWLATSRR
jgi:drug/metabolite transporter (DMT)-like permease